MGKSNAERQAAWRTRQRSEVDALRAELARQASLGNGPVEQEIAGLRSDLELQRRENAAQRVEISALRAEIELLRPLRNSSPEPRAQRAPSRSDITTVRPKPADLGRERRLNNRLKRDRFRLVRWKDDRQRYNIVDLLIRPPPIGSREPPPDNRAAKGLTLAEVETWVPYPLLGLPLGGVTTRQQVHSAYRTASKRCHPDVGGSDAQMLQLKAERERAMQCVRQQ
jgi:hypothetical protein